ncbi:tRNA (guanine-N(7)-)-methyltransferase [Gossypium arboreum]|uniref:tRNA (Guanine-N(7)-)-methyltransferase n=1 Tax=Gossypium arboreum TaxID=29729 RepID=A0A0B0MKQ1_GOSAR|nr:tRNA (guanine-N(7)-)-methyltransferase [Gossypium arboreum]
MQMGADYNAVQGGRIKHRSHGGLNLEDYLLHFQNPVPASIVTKKTVWSQLADGARRTGQRQQRCWKLLETCSAQRNLRVSAENLI